MKHLILILVLLFVNNCAKGYLIGNKSGKNEKRLQKLKEDYKQCDIDESACRDIPCELGELFLKIEEEKFNNESKKYDRQVQKWIKDDTKVKPNRPVISHDSSKHWYRKCLKTGMGKNEAVGILFKLAYIENKLNNDVGSEDYLLRIVNEFPENKLMNVANFRLGEHYLSKGDFEKSIEYYEKIPVADNCQDCEFALYHKAESYYNLNDYDRAKEFFLEYYLKSKDGVLKGILKKESFEFLASSLYKLKADSSETLRLGLSKKDTRKLLRLLRKINEKNVSLDRGNGILKYDRSKRNPQEILELVRREMPSLRDCYNKYLRYKPSLKGVIEIEFEINPDGEVIKAKIISTTVNHKKFENELLKRVQLWQFTKITGVENDLITIPFTFYHN